VKAGLPELQYPGVKTGLMGKPDETHLLGSSGITTRDAVKASSQDHAAMNGGKDANGAPKSA
jgi:hypothetical protein